MVKTFSIPRAEQRVPMTVAVHIAADRDRSGVESTFTENVSSRGASVLSSRRWSRNDRLSIASLPGDFHATARVAYCQRRRDDNYVVGLEFLEPTGHWVLSPLPGSGK